MWEILGGIFKVIAEVLGLAKERERSNQMEGARQGGAAEAVVKGSNEVDALIDKARTNQDNLDTSEDAIIKDPDNKANDE